MGDHLPVFRSLCELFPQVDPRMLKAVAIEHHNDADSAVVAVLDEVMPSMTGSVGTSGVGHEPVVSMDGVPRNLLSANHGARETGSSSSAGPVLISSIHHEPAVFGDDLVRHLSANHVVRETGSSSSAGYNVPDEANGSVDSARCTSSKEIIIDMQKNIMGELDATPSFQVMSEQLDFPFYSAPEINDKLCDLTLEDHLKSCYTSNLKHSDNQAGKGFSISAGKRFTVSSEYTVPPLMGKKGNASIDLNVAQVQEQDFGSAKGFSISAGKRFSVSSGYIIPPLMGKKGNASIDLNVAQVQEQDFDIAIPVGDYISDDISLKFPCNYLEVSSKTSDLVPNNEVSPKLLNIENDALAPALDFPITDIRESFVGSSAVIVQKDENNADIDYNTQQSGHMIEHGDIDLIPNLNSNHFVSMASTHSSQSVSIESLEDSIADAKNKKNDLLPSLQLVTKMIEDVELLEEKAEVAKHESSIAGASILTKVEELKEMLNHAKEANDMHAGEVSGERSILTTEARELQSRLQRLSEGRNSYLVVIEEIRQTLEERLAAAQLEYEAAEKEKIEKEASAQALLSKQEKEMNAIVEESIKLQKEAEENLKLKDFLVERGQIVDTLQGEMAVICEDVSQLKRIVDQRLSWSKLQLSTISSLSSSLHSSLHKSGSLSDRTVEAVESTDKHTVAEGARPAVEDPDVEMLDGCDNGSATWVVEDNIKQQRRSNEDGWEFCWAEDA
uniref:Uncharacterized protein n=1 Tax=Avena sativa TaxID=4498 RepID=A0ACD5TLR9_AVESA